MLGLAISVVVLPCRIGFQWLHRSGSSLRVSITLAPTLICTLVLAGILHERYAIPDPLYGALLVYAALSTALPSSLSKGKAADFDPLAPREKRARGEN